MFEKLPKTLIEVIRYLVDPQVCIDIVAWLRWADSTPVCQHCGEAGAYFLKSRRIYKCKKCRKQFSVKMGTIFEESAIGLDKWLTAIWLIANCKNGISSYETARHLGVMQRTGWFMNHRIRTAMAMGSIEKLSGTVEMDEAFIGGDAKNMVTNHLKHPNGCDTMQGAVGSEFEQNCAKIPFNPFQLVSLQDMIRIFGDSLYKATTNLEYLSTLLRHIQATKGVEAEIPPTVADVWLYQEENLAQTAEQLGLERTKERLLRREVIHKLLEEKKPIYLLLAQVEELQTALHSDLVQVNMFYIPPDHSKYFWKWEWFDGIVGVFPKVDPELMLAGNCYATQNYTACVFHLMRAVEAATKVLVQKMKAGKYLVVTIHGGKMVVKKPVELCDWATIIKGLDKALLALESGVKTSVRKKETHEFYSHSIASFRNFKDAWRNKVSHSHKIYNQNDAQYIMANTIQFMQHLSTKMPSPKK